MHHCHVHAYYAFFFGEGEVDDEYSAAWASALKCRGTRGCRPDELTPLLVEDHVLLFEDVRVLEDTGPPNMM